MANATLYKIEKRWWFRKQLESNCGRHSRSKLYTGGARELPKRVKLGLILASSNTLSQEDTFPERPNVASPACPPHSVLEEAKGKRVPGLRVLNCAGREARRYSGEALR